MVSGDNLRFSAIKKPILLALLLLALWLGAQEGGLKLRQSDFVRFWIAGRLFLSGTNPYSLPDVLRLGADLHLSPNPRGWMLFNPPIALTVLGPFALLPFTIAGVIWFGLQFAAVFLFGSGESIEGRTASAGSRSPYLGHSSPSTRRWSIVR